MKALKIILAATIPLLIILFSLQLYAFDEDFYKGNANKFEGSEYAIDNLLGFFEEGKPLSGIFFTQDEISHLEDVRSLIWNSAYALAVLFLLALALSIVLIIKRGMAAVGSALLIGGSVSLGFSLFVIIISSFSFSSLFTLFHKALFTNDLWLLPPTTTLIRLFPESFFYAFSRNIFLNSVYLSLFLMVLGFGARHVKK